jgi:hypothetical protein
MPVFITSPQAYPPLNSNDTTAQIAAGTRVQLSDGGVAVYGRAVSEVAQFNAVAVGVDYTMTNATTAAITQATGMGRQLGFAQTSIASGNYGWFQLSGRPKVKLAANCADRVLLYTTATDGVLDDAVVSIGEVAGVVSKTTISNATAVTVMVPTEAFVINHSVQG